MKMKSTRAYQTALTLIASLAIPAFAIAEEHEHHGGFSDLIPFWINFAMFFVLAFIIAKKAVSNGWPQRVARLEKTVHASKQRIIEAEKKLAEAQQRLAGVQVEMKQIAARIEEETKREVEEVVASAHASAKRITAQAQSAAAAERKSAEASAQRELAAMVVALAEKQLKQSINKESDRRYREGAVGGVKQLIS